MSNLHLYIQVLDGEKPEKAIIRTREIINATFGRYGFSIHEIGENEAMENEVKAFLTVDATSDVIYEIAKDLNIQLY